MTTDPGAESTTLPSKRSKFDTLLLVVGRLLVGAGGLILLFLAYQLWGTSLSEAADQRDAVAEFERQRGEVTPAAPPDLRPSPPAEGPPMALPARPAPSAGEPVAILSIPALGMEKAVVERTDDNSLKKGPGHEPGTAMPGSAGNAVIAGHRTTYGAPFYRLNELKPGDEINVKTLDGEVTYTVTGSEVVMPTQVSILEPTPDNRLTLYTCEPRFSAAKRLVVTAALTKGVPQSVLEDRPPLPVYQPQEPVNSAFNRGTLADGRGNIASATLWTLITAVVGIIVWLAGRRWRRLVAYPLGLPVVGVALFFTFEKIATLLPSAL